MCQTCGIRSAKLSIDQERSIAALAATWDVVAVYDSTPDFGKVLVTGYEDGIRFTIRLVAPDGSQDIVTDPLNQFHWLEDIRSGRFDLIARV